MSPSSHSPDDRDAAAKQARQDARRERNRVAAQNSRDRKLHDFHRLADDNAALRAEVADLRAQLAAFQGGGAEAGAGAARANGGEGGGGSGGKRKRIVVKGLQKKGAGRRKGVGQADGDEEGALEEEGDELFDLDEAPRSSPRPDDSIFGINRVGSALVGLKTSYLVSITSLSSRGRWFVLTVCLLFLRRAEAR